MALISCSECSREISDKAASCPQCGAPVESQTPARVIERAPTAVVAPASASATEVTYYSDDAGVRITSARAIMGARTYAMANVTSVTVGTTEPPRGGPVWLGLAGIVFFLFGLSEKEGGAIAFGVLALAGASWWFQSIKDMYHVRLGAAGGEADALSSPNQKYIKSVAHALNEAIIKRG